jgi:hypothetical protein
MKIARNLLIAVLSMSGFAFAQKATPPTVSNPTLSPKSPTTVTQALTKPAPITDLRALVVQMVANEAKAANDTTAFRYVQQKQEGQERRTYGIVQTNEGAASKLLLVNGQPASDQQAQAQNARMQNLANNKMERDKAAKETSDDAAMARQMLQLLPDAFVYDLASEQGNIVTLNFKPNRSFHPPDRKSTVFHAMAGQLQIDTTKYRLVRFQGELTSDVDFLGGFLGHVKKGGKFDFVQAEVLPNHWEMTKLVLQLDGRALIFHGITVRENFENSSFTIIPNGLTFVQGLGLLGQANTIVSQAPER